VAPASQSVVVPGTTQLADWTLTSALASHEDVCNQLLRGRGDVAFVAGDGRLTVRYPREGDRMQPFGMKGHKKLSDIFIDLKIPRRKRVTTPVIEIDGEIVWVVGVATSERCRVTRDTPNVVRLTATRSQS